MRNSGFSFAVFLAVIGNLLGSIWYTLGQRTHVDVGYNGPYIDAWIGKLLPDADQTTL